MRLRVFPPLINDYQFKPTGFGPPDSHKRRRRQGRCHRGTGLAAHGQIPYDGTPAAHLAGAGGTRNCICGPLQRGQIHLHQHADAAKQLAFASKRPGRTQHINLFSLGKQGVMDAVLADLPGYGYAAVPQQDKLRWQQVMANYLVTRENLKAIVLMCDPRHGLTELDEILLDIIRPRVEQGLKFLVVLTKADKLTRSEQSKALPIMQLQAGGGEVRLFSAPKRQGIDEIATLLWRWAHPALALSE